MKKMKLDPPAEKDEADNINDNNNRDNDQENNSDMEMVKNSEADESKEDQES